MKNWYDTWLIGWIGGVTAMDALYVVKWVRPGVLGLVIDAAILGLVAVLAYRRRPPQINVDVPPKSD